MSEYNYSIIIPHKNIPMLLERCLASIPKRDDLEVIIVDDNSDPSIVDFDNFPGLNDPFVEIFFDKSGKGAGHARNVGIEKSSGKKLIFADADDIFTDLFLIILNDYVDNDSDIIYFKSEYRDANTLEIVKNEDYTNREIDSALIKGKDQIRFKIFVPWGKIISHKLIEDYNIRCEECKYGNDTRFAALCDYYAKTVEVIDYKGYCYMIRQDSLWHSRNLEWAQCRFNSSIWLYRFMKKRNMTIVAQDFKNYSWFYLGIIRPFSKRSFFYNLFNYCLYTQDWKKLFVTTPRLMIGYYKNKLG